MQGVTAFQWMGVIAALLFGLGGLIRGIQMNRGRLDLISDWDNRPLPNQSELAPAFARVYIRHGCVFFISPIALWNGLPLLIFGIILAVLVWFWFEEIEKISTKARSYANIENNPSGNISL